MFRFCFSVYVFWSRGKNEVSERGGERKVWWNIQTSTSCCGTDLLNFPQRGVNYTSASRTERMTHVEWSMYCGDLLRQKWLPLSPSHCHLNRGGFTYSTETRQEKWVICTSLFHAACGIAERRMMLLFYLWAVPAHFSLWGRCESLLDFTLEVWK